MSSYIFDQIKPLVATGGINFQMPDDVLYIALVDHTIFDDFNNGAMSNSSIWSDISNNEIINDTSLNINGYEILPLINITLTYVEVSGFTQVHVKANDILYPISTIDAYGAVIFRNDNGNVNGPDGTLITALDFGGRVSSNNGVYTVKLSDGFLRIK